jgi:threonyl-tRNA synthetase
MAKQQQNDGGDMPQVFKMRHSLAHVMAQAIQHLYSDVKLGIGPAIDNGFYYDFIFTQPISDKDLPAIEQEMRRILAKSYSFDRSTMKKDEAIEYLYKVNQPFKAELASELPDEEIGFYTDGDFTDMCKGPHVDNTSQISPDGFKLSHIAGAYWRGDEKRPMMQRIYGYAFETKEDLVKYEEMLEEAKKRDHRKLGKQLDLFTFSDLVGSGLPLYTPRGTFLRSQLLEFSESLQRAAGYEKVCIPHITKSELYKVSGHWDKYKEDLFLVKSQQTDDEFVMKPMNCPHHIQIFASQKRSYRDLPIRYMESTACYRDEQAGELLGLSRVRAFTQDDAHIFCRPDQVEEELGKVMQMVKTMYDSLGMTFRCRLSFRDPNKPEKYLGTVEEWEKAQSQLEAIIKKIGYEYYIAEGEAAFYGPKIDIMVIDALGREWQCATEQADYFQPQRFGLSYTDSDGQEKTPVMVHKALLGSIDRFLSVYIEHTGGNFPLWLSYEQAVIIPVSNEKHIDFAFKVRDELRAQGIRAVVDDANETMGNKIRKAQGMKTPYMLVVGDKEIETNTVAVRLRSGANLGMMKTEEIAERMVKEIETKA